MRRPACLALAALITHAAAARAQHHVAPDSARAGVTAMAIGVVSHATPGALRQDVTEGYLTQPMVAAFRRFAGGRVELRAILNLEGATLRRGEINPGAYGEGYADRRHPHTWLHEAVVATRFSTGAIHWSVAAGKGFVPFGTEDPMRRPLVKFPANHHHAQILERALVSLGLQYRSLLMEGALFNGDEPESPSDFPNRDRIFDSGALRLTWEARPGLTVATSVASVKSPEFAQGGGLDQRKRSAALRYARPNGALRYALVEYANTREFSGTVQAFAFHSALGEAALVAGPLALAARVERTERPEEERAGSPYRTIRPLLDFNILGRTRWTNVTLQAAATPRGSERLWCRPFVELGYHVPRAIARPTPLDPVDLFGSRRIWMLSAGLKGEASWRWP